MNEERKAFKDWFDEASALELGRQIGAVYPDFDHKRFITLATTLLREKEFHQRIETFADALTATLPKDVPQALDIITRSFPPILKDTKSMTNGWLQWPVGWFIARNGLPYFEESMVAMLELTQRFTAEFAVRPFVEHRPQETLARLLALTSHPNPHVRRWCSEGVRTRLPWGKKLLALIREPAPIWLILEALKDDPDVYVRRSVANNLNDIAKDHPQQVVDRCREWCHNSTTERMWVIRHGLRSLIKEGHSQALEIMGYVPPLALVVDLQVSPASIRIGESIRCTVSLHNNSDFEQLVLLDYAIHYIRQNGKAGSKVFKWKQLRLSAGEKIVLQKNHSMRLTSARALYPGAHRVEVQVNGQRLTEQSFMLIGPV